MRVLFLDDEENQRRIVSKSLSKEKIDVTAVSTMNAAREAIQTENFDILILDVMLPNRKHGGIEFLNELRREGVKTPVIFYTSIDFNSIRDVLEEGVNCLTYIPKGTPLQSLVNKVKDMGHLVSNTGRHKLDELQSLAEKLQESFRNGEASYNQLVNGGV